MKKDLLFVGIAAIAILFASCKKEYTCVCTVEVFGVSSTAEAKAEFTSKKKAEDWCEVSSYCKLK